MGRNWAALLGPLALATASACSVEAVVDASRFRCDPGGACPAGLSCSAAGYCEAQGRSDGGSQSDGGDSLLAYEAAVLADSPILYYRFEDTVGSSEDITRDSAVGGHDGAVEGGVVMVPGVYARLGTAAQFSGDGFRILTGHFKGLLLNEDFTIEAWLRVDRYENDFPGYVKLGNSEGGVGYIIYYTDGKGPTFKRATVDAYGVSTGAPVLGEMHHYVVTFDRGDGLLRWYVDGELVSEFLGISYAANDSSASLSVGRADQNGAHTLDEFAMYGRALPTERVLAHFTAADVNE